MVILSVKNIGVKICCSLCLLFVAIQFWGCGNDKSNPDVSNIQVNMTSVRFDQSFAKLDTGNLVKGLQHLKNEYPFFLNFYLDTLMGFGIQGNFNDSNLAIAKGLKPFLSHPDIHGLLDTVAAHFPNVKQSDEDLKKGFQYMKYYYPNFKIPKVVYFISGLNKWYAFTVDSSLVGVGLDMFLGEKYPYYQAIQIPNYALAKCCPEYIPVNVFQTIFRNQHPFNDDDKNLLDMMIQRGKEQYFLSKIIPFVADAVRIGYSEKQLKWCQENEAMIYNFLVKENLLYETGKAKIVRFVNDGPNSVGMTEESPGNIGTWVGWQIVAHYVSKHPNISLEDLLKPSDPQQFLFQSGYKPR